MKHLLYGLLFMVALVSLTSFVSISNSAYTIDGIDTSKKSSPNDAPEKCKDDEISLNMNIPFVGKCISKDVSPKEASDAKGNSNVANVFPKLMGGLIRIVMTAIYIIGFLGILVGGFMVAGSGTGMSERKDGIALIKKIILGLILLGASGVILYLINPDFFGVDSI